MASHELRGETALATPNHPTPRRKQGLKGNGQPTLRARLEVGCRPRPHVHCLSQSKGMLTPEVTAECMRQARHSAACLRLHHLGD